MEPNVFLSNFSKCQNIK